jgi:1,4-alpha-glucan branching enzyme
MDVVYNHFGPSDLELWQFDGWSENGKGGIYFYNDWRAETPWGETRPDYGRPEVRQFIRDNALMWLEEYRVDGLRFDSVSHITNVYGRAGDPASDLPEGWSLLQWLHEEIRARQPWAVTIAEDLRVSPSITKPVEEGGLGFNAQWDSPFLLAVRGVISAIEDSHRNLDAVRDAVRRRYQDDAFRRVVYTESHDDVAEGDVRLPERLQPGDAGNWIAKKLSTLGAILVFTSPGIPMIFQGQEFLEDRWFEDQNPLDWSKTETHGGIFRLYRDLIRLRLNRDGQTRGLSGQGVEILHLNQESNVFGFKRTDQGGPGDTTLVFLNFSNNVYENYTVGLPEAGDWHVRFNSDSQLYDGQFANVGDQIVTAQIEPLDQQPCRGQITLAPYSALILSL